LHSEGANFYERWRRIPATRRAPCFLSAFLFVPFVLAKEKAAFPKFIVNANVLVTIYFGDYLADSRVP
jgi:hypothetical protein